MIRQNNKFASALVLALASSLLTLTPAQATNFSTPGWDNAINSPSISGVVTAGGDWRVTFELEAAAVGAVLRGFASTPTPGPNELIANELGTSFCGDNSQRQPTNISGTPTNCYNPITNSSQATSPTSTLNQNVVSITRTFSATLIANIRSDRQCLVFAAGFVDNQSTVRIFYSPALLIPGATDCGGTPITQSSGGGNLPVQGGEPVKYSGPEFASLNSTPVRPGEPSRLQGKKLREILSITGGGVAFEYIVIDDGTLELKVPSGLAPGVYDLVITSGAGRLTHISAIRVAAPKQSFAFTLRSTTRISEDDYLQHALVAGMQAPYLDKARCIANGASLEQARAQAERLCALVKAANPNIKTYVIEPRTSIRSNSMWSRVVYGWN